MRSFAIYRLPFAEECTMLVQHSAPSELSSLTELNGKEGFVIAPFSPSADCPILLLQPDEVRTMPVKEVQSLAKKEEEANEKEADRTKYHRDFAAFHKELANNKFAKIVLSRCVQEQIPHDLQPEEVFWQACKKYPRQFVALFSTPQSGIWLMATPEILLDGDGTEWRTMALAGTMRKDGPWDEKDCKEQEYVADYIEQCLADYATDIHRSQPYTRKAATLYHRCSDFKFRLKDGVSIGNVISALHPTPAVCGIPKYETQAFIMRNESHAREYYSGFCGPLQLNGSSHLFVSLRCMKLIGERCRLFSGGGLLEQSDEKHEWKETEYKLNTMMDVLR